MSPPANARKSLLNKRDPSCVLVVEDDRLLRSLAAETLREEGYATIEAGDAPEALAALDGERDIAAMITDIRMPGTDGLALAQIARARRPGLAIVISSGLAEPDVALPPDARFLAKPYTAAKLVSVIGAAITAAG